MKYKWVLLSLFLIVGCTQQVLDATGSSQVKQECVGLEQADFKLDSITISTSMSDLPLTGAYPEPGSNDFPVNNIIILMFEDDESISQFSFNLYELPSLVKIQVDTTTFDLYAGDFGLKPMVNSELVALKPNTEYLVEVIGTSKYYYKFTTGGVDESVPELSRISTLGPNLELTFSERVVLSSINSETVSIDCVDADFNNVGTSGSSSFEDKKLYVPVELSDGCTLSISGVRDLSGNELASVNYSYSGGVFSPASFTGSPIIYDYQSYDSLYGLSELCFETHAEEGIGVIESDFNDSTSGESTGGSISEENDTITNTSIPSQSIVNASSDGVIDWAESISFSWVVYKNGVQWHKRDYYYRGLNTPTPDIRVIMYDYNTIDFILLGSSGVGYYRKSNDEDGWVMMGPSVEYQFSERWDFFDPEVEVAVYSESEWLAFQSDSLISEDDQYGTIYAYHYEDVELNPSLSDLLFSS